MSSNVIDYFAVLGKPKGALTCKTVAIGWEEAKVEVHPSELWSSAITDVSIIFAGFYIVNKCACRHPVHSIKCRHSIDRGETLPDDSWEIIQDTVDGGSANLNSGDPSRGLAHIAVKRRSRSRRLDHIVEVHDSFPPKKTSTHLSSLRILTIHVSLLKVSIIYRGEEVPDGFEQLSASVSGLFPADINTAAAPSVIIIRRADSGLREYFIGTSFVDDICIINESNREEVPEDYHLIEKFANKGTHFINLEYPRV